MIDVPIEIVSQQFWDSLSDDAKILVENYHLVEEVGNTKMYLVDERWKMRISLESLYNKFGVSSNGRTTGFDPVG